MSFYLGVWNNPTAISDDQAAARYLILSDEQSVESEFDERVYTFYCRLTGLYPEVEMVPEDELDACPWASGLDVSGDHVIMAIQPEKSEKVIPQVLALAEQLELVCYDPQASKVYLPSRLRAEPVAAAAGAACASRSQPTPTQVNAEPESGSGEGPQPNPSCGVLSEQESVTNVPQRHLGTTMGNTVFISWSGERSRLVAEALRGWLPFVFQTVKPWMSVTDAEKGSRWQSEISARLAEANVGIICLTPENLNSPWLLFEAGALSKKLSESRVCTYLLDLTPAEVRPPMGMLQHTVIGRNETRQLLDAINNAQANPVVRAVLDASFAKFWPELDEKIKAIPPSSETGSRSSASPKAKLIKQLARLSAGIGSSMRSSKRSATLPARKQA